jgi:hypothetical protein
MTKPTARERMTEATFACSTSGYGQTAVDNIAERAGLLYYLARRYTLTSRVPRGATARSPATSGYFAN